MGSIPACGVDKAATRLNIKKNQSLAIQAGSEIWKTDPAKRSTRAASLKAHSGFSKRRTIVYTATKGSRCFDGWSWRTVWELWDEMLQATGASGKEAYLGSLETFDAVMSRQVLQLERLQELQRRGVLCQPPCFLLAITSPSWQVGTVLCGRLRTALRGALAKMRVRPWP